MRVYVHGNCNVAVPHYIFELCRTHTVSGHAAAERVTVFVRRNVRKLILVNAVMLLE